MSLTASMWTSVSGLINHGEKMNVIGNNIANINTVGFKGQRMDFMDFVYQETGSASGFSQIGRGVSIGAIYGDFGQGALETSTEVTDLAISGKGYFSVVPKGTENAYYTRAGNFRFDKDGYLTDPHGYVLQGWEVPRDQAIAGSNSSSALRGAGAVKDIRLDDFSVSPRHTNNITFNVQLNNDGKSNSVSMGELPAPVTDPGAVLTSNAANNAFDKITFNGKVYNLIEPVDNHATSGSFIYNGNILNVSFAATAFPGAGNTATAPQAMTASFPPVTRNISATFVGTNIGTAAGAYTKVTIDGKEHDLVDANGVTLPSPGINSSNPGPFFILKDNTLVKISLPPLTNIDPTDPSISSTVSAVSSIETPNSTPFFALFNKWDANKTPTLAGTAYEYSTNLKIYDEGGAAHVVTVYFDRVMNQEVNGGDPSAILWEYIVTMDPADDKRSFNGGVAGAPFDSVSGNKNAGLLMTGTMSFDSKGQLKDSTAFAPDGGMTVAGMTDLENWKPAVLSDTGLPLFAANFSGREGQSFVNPTDAPSLEFATAINFGIRNTSGTWNLPNGVTSAAHIGIDATKLPSMDNSLSPLERSSAPSTSYGSPSATILQKQDGYSYGFLSNVSVSAEGVISGRYSNGVIKELYQITLFDFVSQHELRREGGNLFTQTRESGESNPGIANNNGMGAVKSNSLEQSNVDLSREFTQMITTQRGFQANSKGITTVDTMLETVIGMKR
ncbi:flagellar hook protein FlgE [Desulfovibrio litoralis]|uniref:Flagellar hook protein FlgE n=1 Tax=Desulfovibrio litoralis DSM 11393 TaxID=1121455 RepID=A0A1M7S916_9BACT|nr:flagellar hook-basal body complex protein [Desulfovibrio litoralis]SHN54918.1 Flagella basal body rod protein [Desulfovibrio litoralis DSM 11393]